MSCFLLRQGAEKETHLTKIGTGARSIKELRTKKVRSLGRRPHIGVNIISYYGRISEAYVGVHKLFFLRSYPQQLFGVYVEYELLFPVRQGQTVYHGYFVGRVVPGAVAAEEDFVRPLHPDYPEELFVLDKSGYNAYIEPQVIESACGIFLNIAPELHSAEMRCDYFQLREGFCKGCKALRGSSYAFVRVWVPASVEYGDEPKLLYFFVYGEHSLLMGAESLIFGVKLDAVKSQRLYALYLGSSVRRVGVDSSAAVKTSAHYRGSPVVYGPLLRGFCGYGEQQCAVYAVFGKFFAKSAERSVSCGLYAACTGKT